MTQKQQKLISSTFQGKKVFLTGHTGFKGSWMLAWLNLLGADVRGYALAPLTDADLYVAMNGDRMCKSTIADIRDQEKLKNEITAFEPHFIFHLAAQPLVRLSYDIPIETFEVNSMGTAYLLNTIRSLAKPCTTVIITTDKVYENREWIYPYRESDTLGGHDPYSASKAVAEIITSSFIKSYFNNSVFETHRQAIATVRAGNVIGGGDWAKDRIIPDLVRAFSKQENLSVRNPESVRPWQHVLEPIAGYLLLAANLAKDPLSFSGAWNFGPVSEDNLPVKELVDIARSIWGEGEVDYPSMEAQPHEAGLLRLDISKSTHLLGWHPRFDAKDSIRETIEWYKEYIGGEDARSLVEKQIKKYLN